MMGGGLVVENDRRKVVLELNTTWCVPWRVHWCVGVQIVDVFTFRLPVSLCCAVVCPWLVGPARVSVCVTVFRLC